MNHGLNIQALQRRPRHSPEGLTIVSQDPDLHNQFGQSTDTSPDVNERKFAGRRYLHPVRIRVLLLMLEPPINRLRLIRRLRSAAPHVHNIVIRQLEVYIWLPPLGLDQPSLGLQPPVEWRSRQRL